MDLGNKMPEITEIDVGSKVFVVAKLLTLATPLKLNFGPRELGRGGKTRIIK